MLDFEDAIKNAQNYVGLLAVDQNYIQLKANEVNNRQHSFCIDVFYNNVFVGHVFVDYWCGMINPFLTTSIPTLEEYCNEVHLPD